MADQAGNVPGSSGTTAAPGTVQQATDQGQAQQGSAGFRQYFPDVPDEHWQLIEPHMGRMQGYVTQLQQQAAPFKQFIDSGYTAEQAANLLQFEQRFGQSPLEVWIELGQLLQQGNNGQPPVMDPEVDLEHLAALARGEDPDAAPGAAYGPPGAQQFDPQTVDPGLMEYVRGLEAKVQELDQGIQQDRTQRQTVVQDRLYDQELSKMRQTLQQAGWPPEMLSDESLGAQVIVHRGNFGQATKALVDQRTGLLKGFTDNRNQEPEPTDLPNGAPPTANRDVKPRDRNDPWKAATRNAQARLARNNRANAQG